MASRVIELIDKKTVRSRSFIFFFFSLDRINRTLYVLLYIYIYTTIGKKISEDKDIEDSIKIDLIG